MPTPYTVAIAQAAADRKRHTGLGRSPANVLSWKIAIPNPAAGFSFYKAKANYSTSIIMAGGGDGATGPRLWLRSGFDQSWREITSRLPTDAAGDLQDIANSGSTWWAAGVDSAGTGGGLAYSANDGDTWTSWTVAAGVTKPLRCLLTLAGLVLYYGGDDGFLKKWTAPATYIDLTAALGWSEMIRDIATWDGVSIMVVGGDSPTATETCSYSANGGAAWTARTAALGTAKPLYDADRRIGQWIVCGDDTLARTGDDGANWDDWLTAGMEIAIPLYDTHPTFQTEMLLASNLGLYLLYDSGFTQSVAPAALLQTVYDIEMTAYEIFAAAGDLWISTRGGAVVAYAPLITRVRTSSARWVALTASGVAHYGQCQLTALVVTGSVADTITVYDNTAASGTSFVINLPAGGIVDMDFSSPLQFQSGIYTAFTQATTDILVSYIG